MPLRRPPDDLESLLTRLSQQDRGALSRLLSLISQGTTTDQIAAGLAKLAARPTPVIAFTGSGGVGKSSLLNALSTYLQQQGKTIGILACDPESPVTKGALLGDRCRITSNGSHERIFLRSLSTTSGQQGVAERLDIMLAAMRTFGFDCVLMETVGAGQGDTAVRDLADVLVLVLQPQTGDELQWEKAGQLEVADVVAVNKSDLPGADTVIADLRHQVDVPVVKVSVARNEGIAELWQTIEDCEQSVDSEERSREKRGEAGKQTPPLPRGGGEGTGSEASEAVSHHRARDNLRVQSANSNHTSSPPVSERTPVLGLRQLTEQLQQQETVLRQGKESPGKKRPGKPEKLPVRKRLSKLLDPDRPFFELGLWAAHGMYPEWGDVPAAGLVAGIGWISGRPCLVAANDAAVKSGAMFPQSVKKLLRMQKIAYQFRLPLVYLVDSAGVFLPLQDEIFPDEDDFGRIFRNNAVLSAAGIPQYAAVMGNCIAGGAYLPVLSDKILMTEGSQMCLAGPALVKAAIGQNVDPEELGGAAMHASISGTVDFHEPDDPACLQRLRSLIALLPDPKTISVDSRPEVDPERLYDIVSADGQKAYDVRDVLKCIVDADSLQEFKAEYGQTLVTTFARIGGRPVGIVANQKQRCRSAAGELQIGGVIYDDAADKAARFVMDCNQTGLPLIFFQDVQGFIVGKRAEQSGIIRAGAKLVNVVSNSVVPKLTVILGGSFGAGNYALCGKAYDPALILAWPSARYAVMGASQAADTLLSLRIRDAERKGKKLSPEETAALRESISSRYVETTDIRYGAARGWVDAIIAPHETREWLAAALEILPTDRPHDFRTGVLQV